MKNNIVATGNRHTKAQTFTLPTPQASTAGFGTITFALLAFPGTFENEDRWQIETITVTALDSHRALAPAVLFDLGNHTTNSGDKHLLH
jgi:hypothetical protein